MANLICPKCKTENPPDNMYCLNCGTSLKGVKPATGDKTVMAPRAAAVPPPTPAVVPPPPPAAKAAVAPPPPLVKSTPPAVLPPPAPAPAAIYAGTPISRLGAWQDGFIDIVEGEAGKADKVAEKFIAAIKGAGVDGITVAESTLTSGTSPARKYHLVYNGKGATAAVRFATFGRDLYYSWDLYSRREVNWLPLAIIGGAAFVLAVLQAVFSGLLSGFIAGLESFFTVFLTLLLVPGLALLLFGKLLKDDIWGLIIRDIDDFAMDDANALGYLVDEAVMTAVDEGIAEAPEKPKAKK